LHVASCAAIATCSGIAHAISNVSNLEFTINVNYTIFAMVSLGRPYHIEISATQIKEAIQTLLGSHELEGLRDLKKVVGIKVVVEALFDKI
jgi:hypothetical protein